MAAGNGKNGSVSFFGSSNKEFKPGMYFRREGWTPFSDEIVQRIFTSALKQGPFLLFVALTRIAWMQRNLSVRRAGSLSAAETLASERSIDRHFSTLRKCGLVRLEKFDKDKGNIYFVEPVLIWSGVWNQLEGIAMSRAITDERFLDAPPEETKRQNDASPVLAESPRVLPPHIQAEVDAIKKSGSIHAP